MKTYEDGIDDAIDLLKTMNGCSFEYILDRLEDLKYSSTNKANNELSDAQKLASAIADAATQAGITDSTLHSFSGPQLLLLLDDLVELATRNSPPILTKEDHK